MLKLFYKSFVLVLHYTKQWGWLYIICSILVSSITVLQFYILQDFVNHLMIVVQRNTYENIFLIFLLLSSSYILQIILEFFISRIDIITTKQMVNGLYKTIAEKVNKIDYVCFENDKIYNLILQIGEEPQESIKQVFLSALKTLQSFILLIGVASIFIQVSPILAGSLFILLTAVVFCSTKGMNILNETVRQQSGEENRLKYFNNLLYNKESVLELKLFCAITYIVHLGEQIEKNVIRTRTKKSLQADCIYNISTILIVIWVVIASWYSGTLVFTGGISIGIFVAEVRACISLFNYIEAISTQFSDTLNFLPVIQSYYDFLMLPERAPQLLRQNIYSPSNFIEFKDVSFHYPGTEKLVLDNINFKIDIRKRTAIVGENGSGKSTIIKLLCDLFPITAGNISCPIKTISPVYQDYMNYYMTLRENIGLADVDRMSDDSQIIETLKKGQCENILTLSKLGLEVNLGKICDNGIDLSGGQWQRLAVSRALFQSDAFIILDEPTAAMDPIAESKMYKLFLNTLKKQGCLIISHRLASAKMADEILVLHNGKICEKGTHEQLMNLRGIYYKMFSIQSSWYTA